MYLHSGQMNKAEEELNLMEAMTSDIGPMNQVLNIWKNAYPDFEPVISARAFLSEWEGG